MKAQGKRSRTARLAVVVAAIVVLAAVLVAPALAAPALAATPTSWTVSPTSKIITYGQGVTLNGTLMGNGAAIGGLWVDFAQATTTSGSYEVLYKVTSPTGPYSTNVGVYSIAVMPLQTTYYRFQWAGDSTYGPSNSDAIPVQVKPSLGKPTCPSSVDSGHKFTVSGSVKPGAPTGPAVHVKAYRKNSSGVYASYKTYDATISGTTYKASIKISKAGKYKFKATTGSSARFAANETGFSSVLTVKK
jgi:hypothetical protein